VHVSVVDRTSPENATQAGKPLIYEATIGRIVEVAPETRSFFLRLPEHSRFAFTPGQFISCMLPVAGQTMIRPYSIASSPEEAGVLEICLNFVPGGPGSGYLFGLGVGAGVRFTGPWGTFTLAQPPDAECVFIADGTGIAPIRPMLRRALTSGPPPRGALYALRLHYAASSTRHLLYAAEFEAAARAHSHFTFAPLVGDSLLVAVERRYVTADDDRTRHFYICGVGDIVPQLRDLLRRAGYERRAVHYEKW
jgi:ferredoxin-NADP reductase